MQASSCKKKALLLLLSKSAFARKFCFSVHFLSFFCFFRFNSFDSFRKYEPGHPKQRTNKLSLLGVVWLGSLLHKFVAGVFFLLSPYNFHDIPRFNSKGKGTVWVKLNFSLKLYFEHFNFEFFFNLIFFLNYYRDHSVSKYIN